MADVKLQIYDKIDLLKRNYALEEAVTEGMKKKDILIDDDMNEVINNNRENRGGATGRGREGHPPPIIAGWTVRN